MDTQFNNNDLSINGYSPGSACMNGIDLVSGFLSRKEIITAFDKLIEFRQFFQQAGIINFNDQIDNDRVTGNKKSFLVFSQNKYTIVPTEKIALFCIKYDSAVMICFDKQEYFVNYSLEQIQNLLDVKVFYRLNRQYLINFNAIKEVEHYFARKLLVNLTIPVKDKLLVSKEKVSSFLHWLDNR